MNRPAVKLSANDLRFILLGGEDGEVVIEPDKEDVLAEQPLSVNLRGINV